MTRDRLVIFVGTFHRTSTLERTVMSFRRLTGVPYELVLVDNGSSHPAALATLAELERLPEVRRVYRLRPVESMEALTTNFNIALETEYALLRDRDRDRTWFAVTDADVSFEDTDPAALEAYMLVAKRTGNAVGPHMRVDDRIPLGYPLRTRVLVCESRLLYRASMNWTEGIPWSPWATDTTFHLFPAVPEHHRLKLDTARVGPPYDAMHLDWYLDVFNPTEENEIYIARHGGIGSWGRTWISGFWWRFQEDQEAAWGALRALPLNKHNDLDNGAFMRAWGYQIGLGGTVDLRGSLSELYAAVPPRFRDYWAHRSDWLQMVYRADFSCLGWTPAPVTA